MDLIFLLRCGAIVVLIAVGVWTIYQMIVAGDQDDEHLSAREILILALLWEAYPREMHGLELVERADGELAAGTIHVRLGRLEDKALIHSRLTARGAHHLYAYTITERGRRAIRPFHVDRESTVAEDCQ